MKSLIKWIFRLFLFIAWLAFSVVTGGLVLSAKESLGLNTFTSTGYHAFAHCLKSESEKAIQEKILPHSPR